MSRFNRSVDNELDPRYRAEPDFVVPLTYTEYRKTPINELYAFGSLRLAPDARRPILVFPGLLSVMFLKYLITYA